MNETMTPRDDVALRECRAAFEEWHGNKFEQHLPSLREEYGYPKDSHVQTRWAAWQAAYRAQDALVEKLVEALAAALKKGSKWHPCDDVVVRGQEALSAARALGFGKEG